MKAEVLKELDGIDRALSFVVPVLLARITEGWSGAGEGGIEVGNVKPVGFADTARPGKVWDYALAHRPEVAAHHCRVKIPDLGPTIIFPGVRHSRNRWDRLRMRLPFHQCLKVHFPIPGSIHTHRSAGRQTVREARGLLLDPPGVPEMHAVLLFHSSAE